MDQIARLRRIPLRLSRDRWIGVVVAERNELNQNDHEQSPFQDSHLARSLKHKSSAQIARDHQLQGHLVGRRCWAKADAGLDIDEFPGVIDDSPYLMRLLAC